MRFQWETRMIYRNVLILFLLAVFGICVSPSFLSASDLDDGISKYTDGSIRQDDKLGDPEINSDFIVLRAKSRAANVVLNEDGIITSLEDLLAGGAGGDKTGNINSVVLGPGSTVNGDIVIIDSSSGDKIQIITSAASWSSGLGLDINIDGLLDTGSLSDLEDQLGGLGGGSGGTITWP